MARIDDLKKQNPQLDISLIDIIASLDPTSTYKYLGFMLKLLKNEIGEKDPKKCFAQALFDEEYIDYLKRFESHSAASRLKNPDISSYKNINEVTAAVNEADQILKVKESEKQVIKLFESKEYLVLLPLTFEASKTYGANTKWCVTQSQYWKTYQWNYKLIYIIDKVNNKKYAISRKYDDQTKIEGWLENDDPISPFLIPLSPEVDVVITNELRKKQYETEMDVLNENSIMTDEGVIIPFDRTDRTNLKAFMVRFGNSISKSFKQKIQERFDELGIDSSDFKKHFSDANSKSKSKDVTLPSLPPSLLGERTQEPPILITNNQHEVTLNQERTNRIAEIMRRVDGINSTQPTPSTPTEFISGGGSSDINLQSLKEEIDGIRIARIND